MNAVTDLSARAMLVDLRFSCWLPDRIDAPITQEVAEKYDVRAEVAGRYKKNLIDPKTPTYRAIRYGLGRMRTRHYWFTLPWTQNGPRILPAASFAAYSQEMRTARNDWLTVTVPRFLQEWPRLVYKARTDLKGAWRESDYPQDLADRFGCDLLVLPLPSGADFRVSLQDADVAAIRANITAEVNKGITAAARVPYERLHDGVQRIVERLSQEEPQFHDSLITGLKELCDMLPAMNLTGDGELEELRLHTLAMLANVTPQTLRNSGPQRDRVLGTARELTARMKPRLAETEGLSAQDAAAHAVLRQAAQVESNVADLIGGF
jgi:hypothetical protein